MNILTDVRGEIAALDNKFPFVDSHSILRDWIMPPVIVLATFATMNVLMPLVISNDRPLGAKMCVFALMFFSVTSMFVGLEELVFFAVGSLGNAI